MASNWLDDYFGPGSVQNDNTDLPKRPVVAYIGANLVAADDPTNKRTTVTATFSSLVGDGSGNANITGELNNTSNPKVVGHEYNLSVITPTTSPTAIWTKATVTNHHYTVRGIVRVQYVTGGSFAAWEISAEVRNSAVGPVTEIYSTAPPVTLKGPASTTFGLAFAIVAGTMTLTATDPGSGRRWTGAIYVADSVY